MNDYLFTYIENDAFKPIRNEEIMQWFQNMKTTRQERLNKLTLGAKLQVTHINIYNLNDN
jgi:hypothetical protein